MSRKIKILKKTLRIHEEREVKILSLLAQVKRYTDRDLRNQEDRQGKAGILAKHLFYKAALEQGLKGPHLMHYTNDQYVATPYRGRRAFNTAITKNPEVKKFWEGWKQFLANDTTEMASESGQLPNRGKSKRVKTSELLV